MLVYGDHDRNEDPRVTLARIAAALPGLESHDALVALFIEAAELAQGLADAEFEAAGEDDRTPLQDAAMALLMGLARLVARSWDGGLQRTPLPALSPSPPQRKRSLRCRQAKQSFAERWGEGRGEGDAWRGFHKGHATRPPHPNPLPGGERGWTVRMRQAEGYAFYALYPEAYLESARLLAARLPGPFTVIGLRSIGTGLAAMAAVALNAASPVTLRPTGHPFRRELRVSDRLRAALLADPTACFVIVDEGPGLSGSSFGAVADWLESHGVPPARIAFLPGHAGDLGPEASAAHRRRWADVPRPVVTFDALFRAPNTPAPPLECWFEDELGPPTAPLIDLSGGAWRAQFPNLPADWPPVHTQQERRKFLLRTQSGAWLLKFVGLGRSGIAKLERARALHRAGFSTEPIAVRHGFLAERWLEDATPLTTITPDAIARLADYLIFRAKNFPADPDSGASLPDLLAMARTNFGEAGDKATLADLECWTPELLADLGATLRRIVTDNRLHRWEWLRTAEGRLVKTDALDHAFAHDLIGCQDLAWDVAGGIVEFGLSEPQADDLCDAIAREAPLDRRLVAFCIPCYRAFHVGYWSFATR